MKETLKLTMLRNVFIVSEWSPENSMNCQWKRKLNSSSLQGDLIPWGITGTSDSREQSLNNSSKAKFSKKRTFLPSTSKWSQDWNSWRTRKFVNCQTSRTLSDAIFTNLSIIKVCSTLENSIKNSSTLRNRFICTNWGNYQNKPGGFLQKMTFNYWWVSAK